MNNPYLASQSPLVSIGIPAYNSGDRIETALNSIARQQYPNIELIISNDASTDHTDEVCRKWAEKDSRIKYFYQEKNLGLAANFEFVLHQATGKYFMWMADDDHLVPDIISYYVNFLENHPAYCLASGKINYWQNGRLRYQEGSLSFEEDRGLIRTIKYYRKVKEGALLYGMMRREMGQKVRFLPILGSDWHFVAGLAFQGKIKNFDFVGYNKYAGGVSRNFKNYARVFGEKPVWGIFPFIKMAIDAFRLVIYGEKIYSTISLPVRIMAGIFSSLGILFHYYILIKPRIIGGRLLRFMKIKTPREWRMEKLQQAEQE
ncbi:MAG: glycosyltransferase [Bacteroidia bacterium]